MILISIVLTYGALSSIIKIKKRRRAVTKLGVVLSIRRLDKKLTH